ncbi:MAG: hypothetical protein Q8755_02910, partial [Candidatus Phytoplasma australasiaticum]|nr:hypothetical protein [Candidatus Phytoplasma australasiaticum]
LRLEIGEQELQNEQVTIFIRHSRKKIVINASELLLNISNLIGQLVATIILESTNYFNTII